MKNCEETREGPTAFSYPSYRPSADYTQLLDVLHAREVHAHFSACQGVRQHGTCKKCILLIFIVFKETVSPISTPPPSPHHTPSPHPHAIYRWGKLSAACG